MFEDYKVFETTLAGRPLKVETGKVAQLANGSCMVRYGDTVVLCTATMSAKPREGVDFFPLSVDYEEKLYSVGKIPGSFQRREGRPSEKAILTSRVIDRPIRPLFPKDMRNDVSVVCTVMSVDPDCAPEITAMIGTSIALSISDIPWDGPIGGVVVGLVDGKFVINPTAEEEVRSDMHVTVASTADLVAMIEAGANEVDNDTMFDGIMAGHAANQEIVKFINDITAAIGKEKIPFQSNDPDPAMYEAVKDFAIEKVRAALDTDDKRVRDERLKPCMRKCTPDLTKSTPTISPSWTTACTSCRSLWCAAGCWTTESVWTAAASTKSARWRRRWGCCPRTRFGHVHPRPDPGHHYGYPGLFRRCSAAGWHRQRRPQAVYASLQFPVLLRGRNQALPRPWPPRNRTRRLGGACSVARDPLGGGFPLYPAPGV